MVISHMSGLPLKRQMKVGMPRNDDWLTVLKLVRRDVHDYSVALDPAVRHPFRSFTSPADYICEFALAALPQVGAEQKRRVAATAARKAAELDWQGLVVEVL